MQKLREVLRHKNLGAVNVGTVDDYQGQEKRVLFISTVLTHHVAQHHLVFNAKRFNVAVTRAKALLVVVGNPLAMFEDPSWKALLAHAVELHAYRGCPHPLKMEGAEDDVTSSKVLLLVVVPCDLKCFRLNIYYYILHLLIKYT